MNYCQTCKHYMIPDWNTNGFGTCYLPSYCKDKKLSAPIISSDSSYIIVYKKFGCPYHKDKLNNDQ